MNKQHKFGDLIGKSSVMQHVYELITKAAATDYSVVIVGETGTGKELVAERIHSMGQRRNKPFIPVNCGAIPKDLVESELFGHRKGAFTGANRDKQGLFDAAHQGTLFLDEVGEIPPAMQVKLLRAIEGRGYMPVGGCIVKYSDVRIIAATNQNLEELIEQGLMREDFFYRLDVISIVVPPLRERREDIPLLVEHFVEQFGRSIQELPDQILAYFYMHHWSGNIRQLQNEIQRYLILGCLEQPERPKSLWEAVEALERQMIAEALVAYHGQRSKAAKQLQLHPKTLYRKIKKYDLNRNL